MAASRATITINIFQRLKRFPIPDAINPPAEGSSGPSDYHYVFHGHTKSSFKGKTKKPQSPWGWVSPFHEIRNFGKYCGKAFRERQRGRDALADETSATGVPPGLYSFLQLPITTTSQPEPSILPMKLPEMR
jgi:hypothetical protein